MRKTNALKTMALTLCISAIGWTGSVWAENVLTVTGSTVPPNSVATVWVDLSNSSPLTALQFTLVDTPNDVSYVAATPTGGIEGPTWLFSAYEPPAGAVNVAAAGLGTELAAEPQRHVVEMAVLVPPTASGPIALNLTNAWLSEGSGPMVKSVPVTTVDGYLYVWTPTVTDTPTDTPPSLPTETPTDTPTETRPDTDVEGWEFYD